MNRYHRRAQAVVLDALVFLVVAAVVSISLLHSSSSHEVDHAEWSQDYVERAHNVLLRTMVHYADYTLTVYEAIVMNVLASPPEDDALRSQLSEQLSSILDGLFQPRFQYCWTVTTPLESWGLESDRWGDLGTSKDRYLSRLVTEAEWIEGDIVTVLSASVSP